MMTVKSAFHLIALSAGNVLIVTQLEKGDEEMEIVNCLTGFLLLLMFITGIFVGGWMMGLATLKLIRAGYDITLVDGTIEFVERR